MNKNTRGDGFQSRPFFKCTYNYTDAYNKDIRKTLTRHPNRRFCLSYSTSNEKIKN